MVCSFSLDFLKRASSSFSEFELVLSVCKMVFCLLFVESVVGGGFTNISIDVGLLVAAGGVFFDEMSVFIDTIC